MRITRKFLVAVVLGYVLIALFWLQVTRFCYVCNRLLMCIWKVRRVLLNLYKKIYLKKKGKEMLMIVRLYYFNCNFATFGLRGQIYALAAVKNL